jgi:hypothetical protein
MGAEEEVTGGMGGATGATGGVADCAVETAGPEIPLLVGMGGWEEGVGTGAVMLMESWDPRDEREWEEFRDTEELCMLGRRVLTCGGGIFQF